MTVIKQSKNLPGQNITVTITNVGSAPLVYELTASVGQTSFTQRHSIGEMNNSQMVDGPVMDLTTLQAAVDGFAQSVADIAALRENYRLLNAQLSA